LVVYRLWSDPMLIHKRLLLFVFEHAIRLCAVPELNFVRWRKVGRDSISGL
jgi:hypothetical protein